MLKLKFSNFVMPTADVVIARSVGVFARLPGLAVVALLFIISNATAAQGMLILIDPGHGGKDTGAVRGKLKESEIALKVSMLLNEMLKKDPRFKVSMTRTSDEKVSLKRRTEIAKEKQADLYISIHLNTSRDAKAEGKEFYFQNQIPADEDSLFLASQENDEENANANANDEDDSSNSDLSSASDLKRIIDDLRRNHRIHASSDLSQILLQNWLAGQPGRNVGSRAIRQAPFFVVSNVQVPSVLVELGFLSHPVEGPRLAQNEYQQELAKSLYEGLVKYKERLDKEAEPTVPSHP